MSVFDKGVIKWPKKWINDPELRPFLNNFAKVDADVKNSLSGSQSDLSTLTTSVNAQETTLSTLQAEVDAAQADIVTLDTRVDTLYTELDILVTNRWRTL